MNAIADIAIDPYTLLRSSLSLFRKPPADLEREQLKQAARQALNEYQIELRVLSSNEAAGVIITSEEVDAALLEVRSRFGSDEEFETALQLNGLDAERLRMAIYRECKVNTVLDKVSARAPKVSDVEIGIYYHTHPEKFNLPERRAVRHILITVNPDFAENGRDSALQRIRELQQKLWRKPHKFEDLALKYSECPTALQGGMLGVFAKGTLYPEIDEALFALKKNEIGGIVETEIGFHLVQCVEIHKAETLSLQKATPKIRQIMQERYRRNCQRSWLAGLSRE
ncbi:nitrogen fixation protein NifM [Methylotuvimicrobium sp.]|uniref:nitrogen fixation protein NifM n=1 Tax=Methylotuvimicrobium sp. TaxID=2822413 RepID=UPI003D64F7C0